jgi:hypothetical protein
MTAAMFEKFSALRYPESLANEQYCLSDPTITTVRISTQTILSDTV